jgi:hypothetical protein
MTALHVSACRAVARTSADYESARMCLLPTDRAATAHRLEEVCVGEFRYCEHECSQIDGEGMAGAREESTSHHHQQAHGSAAEPHGGTHCLESGSIGRSERHRVLKDSQAQLPSLTQLRSQTRDRGQVKVTAG